MKSKNCAPSVLNLSVKLELNGHCALSTSKLKKCAHAVKWSFFVWCKDLFLFNRLHRRSLRGHKLYGLVIDGSSLTHVLKEYKGTDKKLSLDGRTLGFTHGHRSEKEGRIIINYLSVRTELFHRDAQAPGNCWMHEATVRCVATLMKQEALVFDISFLQGAGGIFQGVILYFIGYQNVLVTWYSTFGKC